MGLFESNGVDDLDLLLYGNPEDSDTESQNEQIVCRQGRGRGARREAERTVPRLPQAAIHHRIALMEVRIWLQSYITFFKLNSAEIKIYHAHTVNVKMPMIISRINYWLR